jgi:hypothetical protein
MILALYKRAHDLRTTNRRWLTCEPTTNEEIYASLLCAEQIHYDNEEMFHGWSSASSLTRWLTTLAIRKLEREHKCLESIIEGFEVSLNPRFRCFLEDTTTNFKVYAKTS